MKLMHAVVQGRVQGVGFRAATLREGRRLGLQGWVRNRADGTVEVLAGGEEGALRQLEAFLRVGPRIAQVAALQLSWPTGWPDGTPEGGAGREMGPFHIL